jgi:hypothetical protein
VARGVNRVFDLHTSVCPFKVFAVRCRVRRGSVRLREHVAFLTDDHVVT